MSFAPGDVCVKVPESQGGHVDLTAGTVDPGDVTLHNTRRERHGNLTQLTGEKAYTQNVIVYVLYQYIMHDWKTNYNHIVFMLTSLICSWIIMVFVSFYWCDKKSLSSIKSCMYM